MSAYICGSDHIKALAIFAAHRLPSRGLTVDPHYVKGAAEEMGGKSPDELATYYANILYCENIRSVSARYPNDTFEDLPGPCKKDELLTVSYSEYSEQFSDVRFALKPVDILKMCDGLEYQSCETDDWDKSLACRLLDRIRNAAIRQLPGYEDGPWDYEKPVIQRRRAA